MFGKSSGAVSPILGRFAFLVTMTVGVLINVVYAQAPGAAGGQVPPEIKVPDGTKLLLHAVGKGDQIYVCKKEDSGYAWTLKGPEAKLFDEKGKLIGAHFSGPAWRLNDGSQVTGRVASHVDSPDSDSIPWLLLNVIGHSGKGRMNDVEFIQRLNTRGGKTPSTGCDAGHEGKQSRASYTADYYFYSKAPAK